jgi:probable rRNA maturation factor
MAIYFYFNETTLNIPARTKLKSFIEDLFKREGKELLSLNYIFCTDEFLLKINKEFLQHDDYTDIITFSLASPRAPIIGEVYISVDRIRENALKFNCTLKREIHRVIFHGALHLCGYRDKKVKDKQKMTMAEDKNLELYL